MPFLAIHACRHTSPSVLTPAPPIVLPTMSCGLRIGESERTTSPCVRRVTEYEPAGATMTIGIPRSCAAAIDGVPPAPNWIWPPTSAAMTSAPFPRTEISAAKPAFLKKP